MPDPTPPPPADYWIRLRPLRDADFGPAAVRLRRLLKVALRAFGLRCVAVNECPAGDGGGTRK